MMTFDEWVDARLIEPDLGCSSADELIRDFRACTGCKAFSDVDLQMIFEIHGVTSKRVASFLPREVDLRFVCDNYDEFAISLSGTTVGSQRLRLNNMAGGQFKTKVSGQLLQVKRRDKVSNQRDWSFKSLKIGDVTDIKVSVDLVEGVVRDVRRFDKIIGTDHRVIDYGEGHVGIKRLK